MYPQNWHHLIEILNEHMHSPGLVAPWGAGPVALASGAGAYNFGAFSNDIIAAAAEPFPIDIHFLEVSSPNTNADYEIELVYGPADTLAGRCSFTRTNVTERSFFDPAQCDLIPAGMRVRARMRDSTGNSTCAVKIRYHHYR